MTDIATKEIAMKVKVSRKQIAAAFRRLARGAKAKQAYTSTVQFYRSGGQKWTRVLQV